MGGIGFIHLLYKVLRDLPVLYRLYTHRVSVLFLSEFVELYKSVEELYKNAFRCILFTMAW